MRVYRQPSRILPLVACVALAFLTAPPLLRSAAAADIAILKSADISYYDEAVQGFRTVLPSQITIKEYSLGGSLSTGQEIVRMLRAEPPSLVFAVGLKATLAAKLELPDTPVVFSQVLDPESYQLPTDRMTGIRVVVAPDQQLSTLRSLLPRVQRVGVLYDKTHTAAFLNEAKQSAQRLGITLVSTPVRSASDVPDALKTLLPTIDALWVIQDRTVLTEDSVPFFMKTLLDAKIPMLTFSDTMVRQGALGGLVLQPWELGRQAGAHALRLLRGDGKSLGSLLDPEQPQLVLNLQIAEYLGINPPTNLLRMARALYGSGAVAQTQRSDRDAR
jgi:putative ABC transport system substrate-binding protein